VTVKNGFNLAVRDGIERSHHGIEKLTLIIAVCLNSAGLGFPKS
jgi:hypothetical protein